MNDYVLYVQEGNTNHILLQFFCEVGSKRIWEVQKEFISEGYIVMDFHNLVECGFIMEFCKVDGSDYYLRRKSEESKCEAVQK